MTIAFMHRYLASGWAVARTYFPVTARFLVRLIQMGEATASQSRAIMRRPGSTLEPSPEQSR